MGLPDNCIRGLAKADYLTNDGKVSAMAFNPNTKTAQNREDGASEVSVNWEDHDKVIEFTLKDYTIATHGVARLPRSAIDYENKKPACKNLLCCERAPILPKNPHHGNIVFHKDLKGALLKMVCGSLALSCTVFSRTEIRDNKT